MRDSPRQTRSASGVCLVETVGVGWLRRVLKLLGLGRAPPQAEKRREAPCAAALRGRPSPLVWRDRAEVGPADLLRRCDPLCRTPFEAGEVVRLHDCEAAYHQASYELLLKENDGRCGCCGQAGTWRVVIVPWAAAPEKPVVKAAPEMRLQREPDGLPRVTLSDAEAHYGRMVRFEGRVVEVHYSPKSGTTFLQFARGYRFHVLKVVIFPRYLSRFEAAGLDPASLEGARIVVRGLLQKHMRWGPQLVIHDPHCIEWPGKLEGLGDDE